MSNLTLKTESIKKELSEWINGITNGVKNNVTPFEVEYDIIKEYFKKNTFKVSPSVIKLQQLKDERLISSNCVVATKIYGIDEYVALCGNNLITKAIDESKQIDIVFIDWLKIISLTNHNLTITPHTMSMLRHIVSRQNVVFGSGLC